MKSHLMNSMEYHPRAPQRKAVNRAVRRAATSWNFGLAKRATRSIRMWLSGPAATAPPTKVNQSTAAWMRSSPQMMPVPKALRATIW